MTDAIESTFDKRICRIYDSCVLSFTFHALALLFLELARHECLVDQFDDACTTCVAVLEKSINAVSFM